MRYRDWSRDCVVSTLHDICATRSQLRLSRQHSSFIIHISPTDPPLSTTRPSIIYNARATSPNGSRFTTAIESILLIDFIIQSLLAIASMTARCDVDKARNAQLGSSDATIRNCSREHFYREHKYVYVLRKQKKKKKNCVLQFLLLYAISTYLGMTNSSYCPTESFFFFFFCRESQQNSPKAHLRKDVCVRCTI